jgi:hypothetical protein
VLAAWFVRRLPRQVVVDLVHLQQLVDGVLETVYLTHRHRGLKAPPGEVLAGRVSPRAVSRERLVDAFRQRKTLTGHPKTGEVDIADTIFLVPAELRGERLVFLVDPDPEVPPLVVEPSSSRPLPVERAQIRPGDVAPAPPPVSRWARSSSQRAQRKRVPARSRRFSAAQHAQALSLMLAGMDREQVAKTIGCTTEALRRWYAEGAGNSGWCPSLVKATTWPLRRRQLRRRSQVRRDLLPISSNLSSRHRHELPMTNQRPPPSPHWRI